jgi:hypothetical protein
MLWRKILMIQTKNSYYIIKCDEIEADKKALAARVAIFKCYIVLVC